MIILELLRCPEHRFDAIAIGASADSTTRVTGSKCCGRWLVAKTWKVDPTELRRVIDDAEEDVERARRVSMKNVKPAKWIKDGAACWYASRPGMKFAAAVSGEPWQLGSGQWVVRLSGLGSDYQLDTDRIGKTTVSCAAVCSLSRRNYYEGGA